MKHTIIIAALLTGCATPATYQPVVDNRGDLSNYHTDLSECRTYASQNAALEGAAGGALAGAASGAATGAVTGAFTHGVSAGEGALAVAAIGAVIGMFQGAAHNNEAEIAVIQRCMSGRGYSVLK